MVSQTLQAKKAFWEQKKLAKRGQGITAERTYTVQAGDSYSSIAGSQLGNQRFFEAVMQANGGAQQLHPGMQITIPSVDPNQQPVVSFDAIAAGLGLGAQLQAAGSTNPFAGFDPNALTDRGRARLGELGINFGGQLGGFAGGLTGGVPSGGVDPVTGLPAAGQIPGGALADPKDRGEAPFSPLGAGGQINQLGPPAPLQTPFDTQTASQTQRALTGGAAGTGVRETSSRGQGHQRRPQVAPQDQSFLARTGSIDPRSAPPQTNNIPGGQIVPGLDGEPSISQSTVTGTPPASQVQPQNSQEVLALTRGWQRSDSVITQQIANGQIPITVSNNVVNALDLKPEEFLAGGYVLDPSTGNYVLPPAVAAQLGLNVPTPGNLTVSSINVKWDEINLLGSAILSPRFSARVRSGGGFRGGFGGDGGFDRQRPFQNQYNPGPRYQPRLSGLTNWRRNWN